MTDAMAPAEEGSVAPAVEPDAPAVIAADGPPARPQRSRRGSGAGRERSGPRRGTRRTAEASTGSALAGELESAETSAPAAPPPGAAPANPWSLGRQYTIGPDGRVRFHDAVSAPAPATAGPSPAEVASAAEEHVEVAESSAAAEPQRGRGRGRRGRGQRPPAEDAVVAVDAAVETEAFVEPSTVEAVETAAETAAEIDQGFIEGETAPAMTETEAEAQHRRRRSRRGGRGRRRNDHAAESILVGGEAVPADVAEDEGIATPVELPPEAPPRLSIVRERERPERSAPTLSPIESLVARQNVLLDQLLQRQERMGRAVEQALRAVEARLKGTDLSRVSAMPRLAVFVDVPNIVYAAERYRVAVDFGKLLEYVSRDRTLIRASAYAPISDDPGERLEAQRFVQPFVEHGYRIVTKPLKRFADGSIKANFDVELAMDILTMSDRLDIISLVSGDGDFRRLVDIVASRGVRVEVVSFEKSTSAELKAVADSYVDLTQHLNDLCVRIEGDFRPRVPRPRIDISGYNE